MTPDLLQLVMFLAHTAEPHHKASTISPPRRIGEVGSLLVVPKTSTQTNTKGSFQQKNLTSIYDRINGARRWKARDVLIAKAVTHRWAPQLLKISRDEVVQALAEIFGVARHHEAMLTILEREVRRGSEMAMFHAQEVKNLKDQLGHARNKLKGSEGWDTNLSSQLKTRHNELEELLMKHTTLQEKQDQVYEELRKSKDTEGVIANQLRDSETKQKSLESQLEYTRDELKESENKNDIFIKGLALFQEEDKTTTDITKEKGPICKVCATKSNELRKLRRANRSMAQKLVGCRVVAEETLNKMAQMNATAEGTADEDGIAAKELLGKREEQIKCLKEELSNQATLCERELDNSNRAKARMDTEVARITELLKLKSASVTALEEQNIMLCDKLNKVGWKTSTHHEVVCGKVLTARINDLEVLAQEKLEDSMAMQADKEEIMHQMSELESTLGQLRRAKALADAEIEKVTWIAEVREQELESMVSRHLEELQDRDSTIESLKKEKEDVLKSIPQGLDEQMQFLLEEKNTEIEALREKVDDKGEEIKDLEEKNRFSHTYANVYEMLHAELDRAEECRNIRERGRAKLDRLLRGVLEDRYGVDTTQELYSEALERMSVPVPGIDEEMRKATD